MVVSMVILLSLNNEGEVSLILLSVLGILFDPTGMPHTGLLGGFVPRFLVTSYAV